MQRLSLTIFLTDHLNHNFWPPIVSVHANVMPSTGAEYLHIPGPELCRVRATPLSLPWQDLTAPSRLVDNLEHHDHSPRFLGHQPLHQHPPLPRVRENVFVY